MGIIVGWGIKLVEKIKKERYRYENSTNERPASA